MKILQIISLNYNNLTHISEFKIRNPINISVISRLNQSRNECEIRKKNMYPIVKKSNKFELQIHTYNC